MIQLKFGKSIIKSEKLQVFSCGYRAGAARSFQEMKRRIRCQGFERESREGRVLALKKLLNSVGTQVLGAGNTGLLMVGSVEAYDVASQMGRFMK